MKTQTVLKTQDKLNRYSNLWLNNFVSIYQQLNTSNLHLLNDIYDDNIVFIDPIHKINGLPALLAYFENLYTNLIFCEFSINNIVEQGNEAAIYWKMTFSHPKLGNAKSICVHGHSHIMGKDNKVVFHRDYFDLGSMLYEHLPIFGKITQWFKKRAGSQS